MGRPIRDFRQGYSYHITVRCNNRDFHLHRRPCREVILYCVKRALEKFDFTLYAICVMSSHVHYLIEPARPDDLPRIMHFVNWYSAMCLNRLLGRRGHFWEKRYHAAGFRYADRRRALNVLRYIHGNPMAAGLSGGFVYPFSNYGTYENLRDDGLTRWHGSFLRLGLSLEECAIRYSSFCQRNPPKPKAPPSPPPPPWGSRLLAPLRLRVDSRLRGHDGAVRGQGLLFERPKSRTPRCQVGEDSYVAEVVRRFLLCNRRRGGRTLLP